MEKDGMHAGWGVPRRVCSQGMGGAAAMDVKRGFGPFLRIRGADGAGLWLGGAFPLGRLVWYTQFNFMWMDEEGP